MLTTVGSREAKLSLPPSVRAPEWRVIWVCAGLSSKSGVPPGKSLSLSGPFSPAMTLTFLRFSLSQITEGVKPTLSELEKFEDQPEGIDLEVVTESTGIW